MPLPPPSAVIENKSFQIIFFGLALWSLQVRRPLLFSFVKNTRACGRVIAQYASKKERNQTQNRKRRAPIRSAGRFSRLPNGPGPTQVIQWPKQALVHPLTMHANSKGDEHNRVERCEFFLFLAKI